MRPPVAPFVPAAILIFLAALLSGVTSTAARAATLTASLDREIIGLNDTATLKLLIEGGTGNDSPRIPAIPGLRLTPGPRGRRQEFANGVFRSFSELSFSISAQRTGEFQIGPITVFSGNQTLQAEPLKLTVVPANDPAARRSDGLENAAFLLLRLPKQEFYVGETFLAEIWLYAVGGQVVQSPKLEADGFTVGEVKESGLERNIRTNNRIYTRVRFLQPLTAARAGDLTVQASDCAIDIPVARRSGFSDIFDEAFAGFQRHRLNLSSPPEPLRILPLPKENVPPSFQGAVGEFQLESQAAPTSVQAGDPITLRVAISGAGNFDAVQIPDQPAWRGFRVYPPSATFEPKDPFGVYGTKRFEQVLTPESPDLAALPPLTFSYFSPATRAYRTLQSAAIPLQISPAPATAALPAPQPDSTLDPVATPEISPLKPHLGSAYPATAAWATQPWFLTVLALPWLGWLASRSARWWISRTGAHPHRRRLRAIDRQIQRGLDALQSHLQSGDSNAFFATLFRVLQEMIGAVLDQPAASITEGVLDTDLPARGVPPETLAALHRLFLTCNQARYAPSPGRADMEALRAEALALRDALRVRP